MTGEEGQVLLLSGAIAFFVLVVGMFLFWLGSASTIGTNAQSAADAAALAGENKLIQEYNRTVYVNGVPQTGHYSMADVCAAAAQYASDNQATVASCNKASGSGDAPADVQVSVNTNQKLGSKSPTPSEGGSAQARATSDSGAQASPSIEQTPDCSAGLIHVAPFQAPKGKQSNANGFSIAGSANFGGDCESRIAGALDKLGKSLKLHVVGQVGKIDSVKGGTKGADKDAGNMEKCGAAAQVTIAGGGKGGITKVTDAQLAKFQLTRPIPGKPNVVGLNGVQCGATVSSDSSSSGSGDDSSGNGNVHLVDYDKGGPAASASSFGGGVAMGYAASSPNQNANACSIYKAYKSLESSTGLPDPKQDPKPLLITLTTASDESVMGLMQNGPPSYGLFQQTPPTWAMPGHGDPISQEMNPLMATSMFLNGVQTNKGLKDVYNQQKNLPVWAIAQNVQVSGAGEASGGEANYGKHVQDGQHYESYVLSGKCK
ncbi:MAG: hypothetical protein J2O48_04110 [Solirubrobacterales bacterium]|nr:hypothetical protein [Solirubrobacterales bacterium]